MDGVRIDLDAVDGEAHLRHDDREGKADIAKTDNAYRPVFETPGKHAAQYPNGLGGCDERPLWRFSPG
jgi:hypothetical protein